MLNEEMVSLHIGRRCGVEILPVEGKLLCSSFTICFLLGQECMAWLYLYHTSYTTIKVRNTEKEIMVLFCLALPLVCLFVFVKRGNVCWGGGGKTTNL